jgi:hypothetical protein
VVLNCDADNFTIYLSKSHLILASENRTIKKIFNTKPEGTRKVGRPRLRWEECVWQDIRILGVRNWRVASNREEWRAILRRAEPTQGCRANIDDDDDDDARHQGSWNM